MWWLIVPIGVGAWWLLKPTAKPPPVPIIPQQSKPTPKVVYQPPQPIPQPTPQIPFDPLEESFPSTPVTPPVTPEIIYPEPSIITEKENQPIIHPSVPLDYTPDIPEEPVVTAEDPDAGIVVP